MAIYNKEPIPGSIVGKIVQSVSSGVDRHGYGYVQISFTDGATLTVEEISQAGQIEWTWCDKPEHA